MKIEAERTSERLKFPTSADIFHVRIWIGNLPWDSYARDFKFCPYMGWNKEFVDLGSFLIRDKAEIKIAGFSPTEKMQIFLARKEQGNSSFLWERLNHKQCSNPGKANGNKAPLGPGIV